MAGFTVPATTRAIVAHASGVGLDYPISMEKLSPLLGLYVVADWREGCEKCIEILKFGGLGHTLGLHTRDEQVVREFALKKPAFRICVNTPAALGAVGYTTNLFPSMTLGCGAQGNNITSDNISPLHLINLKRVAYGVRDVSAAPPEAKPTAVRSAVEGVVDQWLGSKSKRVAPAPDRPSLPPSPPGSAHETVIAPPLASYSDLQPERTAKPAGFVCEDDVRTAIQGKSRITIGKKTIITPSARDLGEAHDIFVVSDN
jgi:hypothetical protein